MYWRYFFKDLHSLLDKFAGLLWFNPSRSSVSLKLFWVDNSIRQLLLKFSFHPKCFIIKVFALKHF